jgi:hypothetical protein
MKALILGLLMTVGAVASAAPATYDREYAYLKLLDMGYYVAPEEIGEMFNDNVFILVNTNVCYELGAELFDESYRSCLMQVQPDGYIRGYIPEPGDTSLYD